MNIIHAHLKIRPEYREQFLTHVQALIRGSQGEEGNISYELYEHTNEPNTFVMVEEWKDMESIHFHNATSHFKEFGEIAKDFFQEPPRVVTFEASPTSQ
ncbi:quinol monooxygenase YgiN [Evansella vedderi]|uniref:Quinol monooxygenase YgiN n=1 Tax=Evansella vedderi TaxID=38282 RepID=A0ABU0A026_9BACI|nr:putative quinol monooxygenase [Evansella vedderi]MDQ0256843.1 quinol monooxygenase YgiN [Evansella vedderi]